MGVTQSADWNTLRNKPTVVTSVNGNTGAVTAAQIIAANASLTLGDIGSYVMAAQSTGTNIVQGATLAGSNLTKINTGGSIVSASLSGTWRFLGAAEGNAVNNSFYMMWVRIA